MSLLGNLFRSSIGRKFLMAVSGIILVIFVTGHLVGNLQIFLKPDHINGYAHFLQSLGPGLWGFRLVMLASVAIHVWAAVTLSIENAQARGSEKYGITKWLSAAVASRYMKQTGVVVGVFIVYHLLHFTVGAAQASTFKSALPEWTMLETVKEFGLPLAAKGDVVHDVYSMVFLGFSNTLVSLFYIVAVGLLTLHLWHGADSMFQTFGLRNKKWSCCLRKLVALYAIVYFLGSITIPGAILSGIAKPAAGTTAASVLGSCSACTTSTSAQH